ncbi:OmpA family protein [Pseudomonadota bacterium]
MKTKRQKNLLDLVIALGLVFALTGLAEAGYWKNPQGEVWKNSYGECWQDRWAMDEMLPECGDTKLDSDGDGVTDDMDECPGTPKGISADAKGCPLDSDGDGVTDDKDRCPGTPQGVSVDSKGCPLDSDGDGVTDDKDRCPGTPRGAAVDRHGCELDSDGDGVVDSKDKCPGTPAGVKVNSMGCPPAVILKGVNFELNSAKLTAKSTSVLNTVAESLRGRPDVTVIIAGHTDNTGNDNYNMDLSQRRAQSVVDYLVSKGANAAKLSAKGYGEERPIASNKTTEGRAENRRVEMVTP